jgi:ferredoxin-NADP reductase
MFPAEPFESRLVASRRLTPAVREMVFERADGAPFRFDPGQWVNLVLPVAGAEGEIKRAYSIASAPREGDRRFEIAVTRVTAGPGSQYLHDLAEGATLRAIGPQGLFTRSIGEGVPSLFIGTGTIGTGTGVTPLRSMITAALAGGAREPLWLLFGARHEEDVLYRDDFEALARAHPNVRYEVTLSRPGPRWAGRSGYVQAHLPELVGALRSGVSSPTGSAPALSPPPLHAYVCGLDRMVSSVRAHLRNDLGLDRKHVHAERYD